HRTRETRRDFADDGRTNRAERGNGALSQRRARAPQSEVDRRQRESDREGRRSTTVQGSDVANRARRPALGGGAVARGRGASCKKNWDVPADHSAGVHARRYRWWNRL